MIEVLKQALEALEQVTKELLAVRDELAERGARPTTNVFHQRLWDSSFSAYTDHAIPAAQSLRKAIAELESQEPVACGTYQEVTDTMNALWAGTLEQVQIAEEMKNKKLYTAPPQRTWQGLTDEKIKTICLENGWDSSWQSLRFAQAIEAKLKEENT